MSMLSDKDHLSRVAVSVENLPELCEGLVNKVRMGILTGIEAVKVLETWWTKLEAQCR